MPQIGSHVDDMVSSGGGRNACDACHGKGGVLSVSTPARAGVATRTHFAMLNGEHVDSYYKLLTFFEYRAPIEEDDDVVNPIDESLVDLVDDCFRRGEKIWDGICFHQIVMPLILRSAFNVDAYLAVMRVMEHVKTRPKEIQLTFRKKIEKQAFHSCELLRLLLKDGMDPNQVGANGVPAFWAVSAQSESVRLLRRAGLNVNARDSRGRTYLWDRIYFVDGIATKIGIDVDAVDLEGETVVHYVVRELVETMMFDDDEDELPEVAHEIRKCTFWLRQARNRAIHDARGANVGFYTGKFIGTPYAEIHAVAMSLGFKPMSESQRLRHLARGRAERPMAALFELRGDGDQAVQRTTRGYLVEMEQLNV